MEVGGAFDQRLCGGRQTNGRLVVTPQTPSSGKGLHRGLERLWMLPISWESTTTSSGWAPWPPRDDQVTSVEFTSSSVSSPFTGILPIGTLNGTEAILWTTRPRSLWTTEGSPVDRQEGSDAKGGELGGSPSCSASERTGPATSAAASASWWASVKLW